MEDITIYLWGQDALVNRRHRLIDNLLRKVFFKLSMSTPRTRMDIDMGMYRGRIAENASELTATDNISFHL